MNPSVQRAYYKFKNDIWSVSIRVARDNRVCARMVEELRAHEKRDLEWMDAYQRRYLLRTLRAAHARIPFYRKLRMNCNEVDCKEFVSAELPVLEKTDFVEKKQQLYPYGGQRRPWIIVGETGGSTGMPLPLFRNYASVLWQNAFLKRQWAWVGFKDGMPRAMLRGNIILPAEQRRPPFWYFNSFGNQLILSLAHLQEDTVDAFADRLNSFSPFLLEAYPSAAYELARYLEKRDSYVSIPYIFTGSEPLYGYQRELIEHRLRGRVMDHYGMGERVAFATECEYGSLHVNTDHSYLEIVDDDGLPTKDYGFIVGTSFHNLVMPLIRYKLQDHAKWKFGTCRCARPYPMLEQVKGRVEEFILGTNGNDIGALLFHVPDGVRGIDRIQIAQVDRYKVEIRVVPTSEFSAVGRDQLVRNLHRYVDAELQVGVRVVDEIPRTQRGKYRWVVNEFINGEREPEQAGTAKQSGTRPATLQ